MKKLIMLIILYNTSFVMHKIIVTSSYKSDPADVSDFQLLIAQDSCIA